MRRRTQGHPHVWTTPAIRRQRISAPDGAAFVRHRCAAGDGTEVVQKRAFCRDYVGCSPVNSHGDHSGQRASPSTAPYW